MEGKIKYPSVSVTAPVFNSGIKTVAEISGFPSLSVILPLMVRADSWVVMHKSNIKTKR